MSGTAPNANEVELLRVALSEKDEEIARLKHRVLLLEKWFFGRSSEKVPFAPPNRDPRQLTLQFPEFAELAAKVDHDLEQRAAAPNEPRAVGNKRDGHGRRAAFPKHAPVLVTEIDVPQAERVCACGGTLEPMGDAQKTRELEFQATRDNLTGLFNRRYADDYLLREIESCRRDRRRFSVALGDIDLFKNALAHLILPASLLGYFSLAYIARMTRSWRKRHSSVCRSASRRSCATSRTVRVLPAPVGA